LRYRFEYASRGSIHCHGLAKLKSDPDLVSQTSVALKGYLAEQIISKDISHLSSLEINQIKEDIDSGKCAENKVCSYIDQSVSTLNPCDPDSWSKPSLRPCKKAFVDLNDFDIDLYIWLIQYKNMCVALLIVCATKVKDFIVVFTTHMIVLQNKH